MKNTILKFASVFILLFFIACDNESLDQNQDQIESNAHQVSEMALGNNYYGKTSKSECNFEYEGEEGPEFWGSLCNGDWIDCDGNVQSPIDIITNTVVEDGDINNININYTESKTDILNNGHTIQFTYDRGSSASLNNIDYNLLQFHFHTGSEHTIDGKRFPMEMHLVHQDPKTKLLAVIGIMFEQGKTNRTLARYIGRLPKNEDDHYQSRVTFKVEDLLPSDLDFYTYSGSLTTPACSEIVTWYVLKEPITASAFQLEMFKNIMHENYRPTQELNGRIVSTKS